MAHRDAIHTAFPMVMEERGIELFGDARAAEQTLSRAGPLQRGDRDSLYRTDHPIVNAADQDVRAQSTRMLLNGMMIGNVPAADKTYLAQLVATRTGLSKADAKKRVDGVIAQEEAPEMKAPQAADSARKAGSYLSIFTALSMLVGAFTACIAAALAGQQRDEY